MRIPLPFSCSAVLFALACAPGGTTEQTQAVLTHHLEAVQQGDVDAIMADYASNAVIYTPNGPVRGHEAIRSFFAGMPDLLPPGFWDEFQMVRQDTEGDLAYIVWSSGSAAPLGTDTFVIREGKIQSQTFAAYLTAAE